MNITFFHFYSLKHALKCFIFFVEVKVTLKYFLGILNLLSLLLQSNILGKTRVRKEYQ